MTGSELNPTSGGPKRLFPQWQRGSRRCKDEDKREMKDKIRNESRPVLLISFSTKKKNSNKSEKK